MQLHDFIPKEIELELTLHGYCNYAKSIYFIDGEYREVWLYYSVETPTVTICLFEVNGEFVLSASSVGSHVLPTVRRVMPELTGYMPSSTVIGSLTPMYKIDFVRN